MSDDIKKLFNLGDTDGDINTAQPKAAGDAFAELLKELAEKSRSQFREPTADDLADAFEKKHGDIEKFMRNGMDKLTDELHKTITENTYGALNQSGKQWNGMILMYAFVRVMKDLYGDVLKHELDPSELAMLTMKSTMKSLRLNEETKADSPSGSMENVLAGMALIALNLTQLTIETEGQLAYAEQNGLNK